MMASGRNAVGRKKLHWKQVAKAKKDAPEEADPPSPPSAVAGGPDPPLARKRPKPPSVCAGSSRPCRLSVAALRVSGRKRAYPEMFVAEAAVCMDRGNQKKNAWTKSIAEQGKLKAEVSRLLEANAQYKKVALESANEMPG